MRKQRGVFVALLLSACATSLWAEQVPLAEVARREAARRQTKATPTKVYTNADVKGGAPLTTAREAPAKAAAGPAPGSETVTPAPAAPAAPAAAAAPVAPKQDQAWWRKRMAEAQEQLHRSRLFAEALQSRVNALWADFSARDDPAQRALIQRDRNEALAELERVKREVAEQEQAIADIEEEARKARVPPGWLR